MLYVVWSSKIIGLATEQSQQAKGEMNQYADTLLTLFPIIRLYSATHMTLNGYINAIATWENHTIRLERKKAWLMSLSAILSSIPLLLLFLVGGHMTMNGILTVGTLYIFLNLSGNVSGVMMNMPGYITAFRQFSANMKRLSPHISHGGKGE
jgi:ABC-type multidrug transport system fused ATPase/permease subunit